MPNGGESQARADRYRARYAQNAKARKNGLDQYGQAQPGTQPYRAEMDSSSELTAPGITAKMPLPERARLAIGYALAAVLFFTGVGLVIVAVAKLL